jgi:hypothetical protein
MSSKKGVFGQLTVSLIVVQWTDGTGDRPGQV